MKVIHARKVFTISVNKITLDVYITFLSQTITFNFVVFAEYISNFASKTEKFKVILLINQIRISKRVRTSWMMKIKLGLITFKNRNCILTVYLKTETCTINTESIRRASNVCFIVSPFEFD